MSYFSEKLLEVAVAAIGMGIAAYSVKYLTDDAYEKGKCDGYEEGYEDGFDERASVDAYSTEVTEDDLEDIIPKPEDLKEDNLPKEDL